MTPRGGLRGSPGKPVHHVTNHDDAPGHGGEGYPSKPKSPSSIAAGALPVLPCSQFLPLLLFGSAHHSAHIAHLCTRVVVMCSNHDSNALVR